MSYEKSTVCYTAEDVLQALADIPQGYREKMGVMIAPDESESDGQVTVAAYFVASPDTNTGYEAGLQIIGNL